MHKTIRIEDFNAEVKRSKPPVLLACIYRDHAFKTQAKMLDALLTKYNGDLKVCLINEEYKNAFKEIKVEGFPTYIIYTKGKEKARMLGKADQNKMRTFIEKALPELKRRKKKR